MRRIIILVIVMWASSPAQADPIVPGELFTPDTVVLNVGAPLFASGNNTFCWQCGDGDPLNDLQLLLAGRPPILHAAGFPGFFTADSLGQISVNGPASNLSGLNVSFSFRVTSTITTKVNPNGSREQLPRPSVAEGLILGAVVGLPRRRELELHYSGRVDGVDFREAFTDPFTVPIGGGSKGFLVEIHVDEETPYTPAPFTPGPSVIPDPTSLLLLGSGLAAAAIRVKRARRHRATH